MTTLKASLPVKRVNKNGRVAFRDALPCELAARDFLPVHEAYVEALEAFLEEHGEALDCEDALQAALFTARCVSDFLADETADEHGEITHEHETMRLTV